MPIPLVVALTLLREALRALAFPLHAALYWLRRDAAQQRSREILAHWTSAADGEALSDFLAAHPPRRTDRPHVFLSAGEPSGEAHAVHLLRAVPVSARVRWTCFGGPRMADAGGEVLVPLSNHAVMGVRGALRALPFLVRTFARFLRLLRDDRPDLVVLVDYPGLHLVMAKAARRAGVPVIHYIAPQYWAWAPWRMARYRGCVDACLAILPFEPAFFRRSGVPCEYVGHPLLDHLAADPPDRAKVAALRADRWLCLLPGSRRAEIERHLPGMIRVARALREADPDARVLVAHRDPRRAEQIRAILAREGADFVSFTLGEVREKLAAAHVVLAKSGTGSLEAALAGAPTVVVYRLASALLTFAYRHFFSVPWFAAANLIAARTVVPERCFHRDDGWDWAAREVQRLWAGGPARLHCLDHLAEVQTRLGAPGASARVAHWVCGALGLLPEQQR
ncbi:MAG TPA: lipid-A-disaccharide synthase [Planctomycetota bacterium]|nr:lipid-A-disaccharide synthase [Planctomycetota bacterium]